MTVSHTFIATVEAISQAGAATEFVDIDERTYCMSPAALEEYLKGCAKDAATGRPLGKRTGKPIKAVLPVHLYGQAADMDAILAIAGALRPAGRRGRLPGAGRRVPFRGRRLAARRARSARPPAFSFYPGKNLGACGEGGAVTTDDEQVAKTVKMLREHGQAQKYYHDLEGYNGRLHAIQAAFLRIKLRHLDGWNAGRRAAAARYAELLSKIPGVTVPFEPETSRAIYHLYVIRTKDRDGAGRAPEVAGRVHRPALSGAGPPAEVLPRLGLRGGQLPGDRARGERDPVAADVPGADRRAAAARGGRDPVVHRSVGTPMSALRKHGSGGSS